MKKKILAYALSALTCGLFTSCSDWLDINHDPNTAEKVDPGYLFNYVAVNWAGTRTGGDFYIPLSMSSQCQVDGGLDYGGWDESVYTISPYSTGNTWKHYYSVGGNNLMLAIKNAEEADPVNHNAIAQCKILLAEHMYEATMLWGDIPFTESWNGTIKYPKFDSQESVLNGVLSLLDEALQIMDLNDANAIDEYDIYYMLSEKRLTLDGFATGISESTIFVMRQMLCFEDQGKVLFRVQDSTGAGGLPGHPPGEAPERRKLGVLSKHHSVFSSNSDRNAQKIRPLFASERQRYFYVRSYLRRRV